MSTFWGTLHSGDFLVKEAIMNREKRKGDLRSGAFIDGVNLFKSENQNWRIDYKKLKEYLDKRHCPLFYNYYNCVDASPSTGDFIRKARLQQGIYKKLERLGFKVITKPLKYIKEGRIVQTKCDMDIDIALDVYNSLIDLDIVVLVTGDSDFLRLVKDCCGKEKRVMIYAFRKNIAWELRKFSVENRRCAFQLFDKLQDVLRLK